MSEKEPRRIRSVPFSEDMIFVKCLDPKCNMEFSVIGCVAGDPKEIDSHGSFWASQCVEFCCYCGGQTDKGRVRDE